MAGFLDKLRCRSLEVLEPRRRSTSNPTPGGTSTGVQIKGFITHQDGKYSHGNFSLASVQRKPEREDHYQLESNPTGTFVGVYGGHEGPQASRFVCENLYPLFKGTLNNFGGELPRRTTVENTLQKTFGDAEDLYFTMVRGIWMKVPQWASSGTCCIVGFLDKNVLSVANLGGSRVVLGRKDGPGITAHQVTKHDAVNAPRVSSRLLTRFGDESGILIKVGGYLRLKGILKVARSIGDAYMKQDLYGMEPLEARYIFAEPTDRPYMESHPHIKSYALCEDDSFIIFGSIGFWGIIGNEEAVDLVSKNPTSGCAKMLVQAALRKARVSHPEADEDDITVVVMFLDWNLVNGAPTEVLSLRSL